MARATCAPDGSASRLCGWLPNKALQRTAPRAAAERQVVSQTVFAWLRGKTFAPPQAPLRDHWVTVHVRLHAPLHFEGKKPAGGYFRILGLRCTPLRLRSLVEGLVSDGTVVWAKTEWHEVDPNRLVRSLRREIDIRADECAWHQSGRVFFPEDGVVAEAG